MPSIVRVYTDANTAYHYAMTDLDREHLLQKIVAVTGFLFALLILPVAQYFLVGGHQAAQSEQGTVAGVSTDKTVTNADVPSDPAACSAKRTQDLADLQKFYDGEVLALQRKHQALQMYKSAQASLPTDATADVKDSFVQLVATEQASYDKDLAPIKAAVDAQTKAISSEDCSVTATATPAQ